MSDERTRGNRDDRQQPAQNASALNAADRLRHTITEDRAQRLDRPLRGLDRPGELQDPAAHVASVAVEALLQSDRGEGPRAVPPEFRDLQRRLDARLDRRTDPQPLTRQGVLQAVREARRTTSAPAEMRVVLGDKVRSRLQPDTRSTVTRRLERGTVVRALERRKSWTLIECDAGGGTGLVQGWVYNKYLQPVIVRTR